ncbi:MAG: glycine zipper family protein [Rhodospirillales bacterium]|nr:glycine zipper family protein [Rhodospirillales bacterium]
MSRTASRLAALGGCLVLGACAVAPPSGPTVMAIPGKGKSFAVFRQEDASCRQYASSQTGGLQPAQAANNAALGSAVLGTALGAATGAAIGSVGGAVGAGAAIGGATGLLAGTAIGASNGAASAGALQNQYNISYSQCMIAQGNKVEPLTAPYPYGGYGYPAYGYAYPYPYSPFVVAPSIGFGWGWGWHGG